MKEKKVPIRTCVCCRREFAKKDLLRIVRSNLGEISLDVNGKADGRGAYVCKSAECLDKLLKKRVLNRVFSTEIPQLVYDGLKEEILGTDSN